MTEVTLPTDLQELAQKLFNEAGRQGNLYQQELDTVRYFENKALYIYEDGN
jgi:hypothetical protein